MRLAAARQAESADPERQKYISQTAMERARQKRERAKILQEIENDKLERKKQQREHSTSTTPRQPNSAVPKPGSVSDGRTKVAVRLPDSKVLRGEFNGENTLADVRTWINNQRNESSTPPYVLQTTFPTRTFEISEEHTETLSSILGKGGQLILKVPSPHTHSMNTTNCQEIKAYSDAYAPAPGLVSSLIGSMTGTISNVLGWTAEPPASEKTDSGARVPGEAMREARIRNANYSARERGVEGEETKRQTERNWFNGNGLAQEAPPPKSDEGKEE